jgi:hypothetical protein
MLHIRLLSTVATEMGTVHTMQTVSELRYRYALVHVRPWGEVNYAKVSA